MKYILLAGSVIFSIAGVSQAMDAFKTEGLINNIAVPYEFNFQFLTVSFTPAPAFVKILLLSAGFFCLYLIWRKLKLLGIGHISDYILE